MDKSVRAVPASGLQIISTVTADAMLKLELAQVPVAQPKPDEVVVRVEAAPINPSDMILLLRSADPAEGRFGGAGESPRVEIRVSQDTLATLGSRVDTPFVVGQEGAGVVVAAGENVKDLLGATVAVLSAGGGMFAQYRTVTAGECVALPDGITADEGASLINPMTALFIAETARLDGHSALIHTAAASNLGQMLVKLCAEDGLSLVNVVRTPQQAELLNGLGAQHVCDSSQPTFRDDLVRGIQETGATVAFDAVGGGTLTSELLSAMEAAAVSRLTFDSPFGSFEHKQVYNYGHLDTTPTLLTHDSYGLSWGVSGWAMPTILARLDADRLTALRQRVITDLKTTFASRYTRTVTLEEALQRDIMIAYSRQQTGEKYLIRPSL